MVNIKKLNNYLLTKELSIDDFYLLYNLLVQQINVKNKVYKVNDYNENDLEDVSKSFKLYLENHQFTVNDDLLVGRHVQILKLRDKGFVEIWNRNDFKIKISDVVVTNKFLDDFFINDISKAFEEFIEMYPKGVYISTSGITYPSLNKPMRELEKIFSEVILKGNNKTLFTRFMLITEMYLKDNVIYNKENLPCAPMNIVKFIESFEGIASLYEGNSKPKSSTGRKSI